MTEVFEVKETVEQWDEDYYHPIALSYYDQAISDMLTLMEVPPGAKVLDAGCGPGVHSIRVAKAGYEVCAIDISNTMLDQARQRSQANNVADKIEFFQKDLTNLDFPDDAFRYVFSWGVIIHIPEAIKAFDELARVIPSGGKLALYLTNKTALDYKIESFVRFLVGKPLKFEECPPLGGGHWYDFNGEKLWVWNFDLDEVSKYLETKGFVLKKREIGALSEIQIRLTGWPRRLLLHLNNLAYRFKFPASLGVTNLLIFEKK